MNISFTKMHGIGNDFLVLDTMQEPLPSTFDFARAAQALCARRFSVGGDGLLTLEKASPEFPDCAARMRMWNPDGTEDMCGNGLRCVALLARARHLQTDEFLMQTLAGIRAVSVESPDEIRVEMGAPRFELAQIPMQPAHKYSHSGAEDSAIEYELPVEGISVPHVTTLSTGSTHTVIFTHEFPPESEFEKISARIEKHAWFPQRTSVMWAKPLSRTHLQLRIWERGVGETLACGTGACAAAVAAIVTHRADENVEVAVQSRGGTLHIGWKREGGILMRGPARIVCEGEIAL